MPAPKLNRSTFTVGQIAKIANVSHGMVTRWIDDGILPGYRLPPENHRRVKRQDLVEFLQSRNFPMEGLMNNPTFTQKVLTLGFMPDFITKLNKAFEQYQDVVVYHSRHLLHAGLEVAKRGHQTLIVSTALGRQETLLLPAILENYPDHKRMRLFAVTPEDEGQEQGLKYKDAGYTYVVQQPVDPVFLANKVWFLAFNGEKNLNIYKE